ncbi:MAG: hypothetical protein RLY86_788 [Pseudomonadota bacterium]|jgi:hypothetical protein
MPVPPEATAHAREAMEERGIAWDWVLRVFSAPDWTEPDPSDPSIRLFFGTVPERGGRVLRVVYNPASHRVVTVFLDRTRRRGPRRVQP